MVCTKINIFLYIVAFWQHLVVQGRFGNSASPEGGGGGDSAYMKVAWMLVVSLRAVYFGFSSHLGCSGQNAIIFSLEGLV